MTLKNEKRGNDIARSIDTSAGLVSGRSSEGTRQAVVEKHTLSELRKASAGHGEGGRRQHVEKNEE